MTGCLGNSKSSGYMENFPNSSFEKFSIVEKKTLSDSLRNLGNSRDSQVFGEFPRFLKESEGVLVFNHWKFLNLTIL
jgi:hypothetical protein